ncbi:MAG: HU family DNA-binding protein [Candidatus Omnitrophica bacterium]|nr:HU family DNA-binding protein [Candidatus Omnitrophota bacterium]
MNKAELIGSIWKIGKYETKTAAAQAYDSVVAAITGRLSKGTAKDRVIRLPELGTFKMKTRKARTGRNPQTGKSIKIPSKKVVTFKGGKNLSTSL